MGIRVGVSPASLSCLRQGLRRTPLLRRELLQNHLDSLTVKENLLFPWISFF